MKNLSLNKKVSIIIAIFVLGYALISTVALMALSEIKDDFNDMARVYAIRLDNAYQLKEVFYIQLINEKNFILASSNEEKNIQKKRLVERDAQTRKEFSEALSVSSEEGKASLNQFLTFYNDWWETVKIIQEKSDQGQMKEVIRLSMVESRDKRLKVEEVLDSVVDYNTKIMSTKADEADAGYQRSFQGVITSIAFTLLAGIIFAFFTLRALGRTIDSIISTLSSNSVQLSSAASQISTSSEQLSQAASEQASSLEQTAASVEELSSMVQKNAQSSGQASSLAESSRKSAGKGQEVMKEMIVAIGDIEQSNSSVLTEVESSNVKISEIVDLIALIADKTKVINDIVFQTKLLSFNASVEAARAGEHGKGFAVVAEEVGSLAQMSGNAAKEIGDLLEDSKSQVEGIIRETKERVGSIITQSRSKVERGNSIAKDCSEVLKEIVENVKVVSQMSQDISTASQEQSQGIQEISHAMSVLDDVTQTNASTSEEAASAATQLSSQANSLNQTVDLLIQTIKGTSESPGTVASTQAQENILTFSRPAKKESLPETLNEADPRFKEV